LSRSSQNLEWTGVHFCSSNSYLFHLRFYRRIHLDDRRLGAFEPFAGEFLRRVETELATAGDFADGVIKHVEPALVKMLSRCGSVLAQTLKRTSLVL